MKLESVKIILTKVTILNFYREIEVCQNNVNKSHKSDNFSREIEVCQSGVESEVYIV